MTPTPSRAIEQLGPDFYDAVAAARFPEHRLRYRNDRAAAEIGLNTLTDPEWLAHLARFEPFPGSLPQPLALRYHGNQFRHYNPDLGDGRGFLFAQFNATDGRLLDLGTKGSGTTPYSRAGDGRLTLKGAVREALATTMLEAHGVPTSRTLSIVETGEALQRGDEPSPTRSAVLVRLSHGHIRIGTFQRLAYLGENENLAELVAYVIRHLLPSPIGGRDSGEAAGRASGTAEQAAPNAAHLVAHLLAHTVAATARTTARLMAAGFVHGVLNSDNINVTGESFDYGPWRFLPAWDAAFTAAYFDHAGLYAYARQPEAIQWNLLQLAKALRPLAEADTLLPALQSFPQAYAAELATAMLARLGVQPRGEAPDLALLRTLEATLTATQAPLDRFWFDWRGGTSRARGYDAPEWTDLRTALAAYKPTSDALAHPYWSEAAPQTMLIHDVEAIWSAIADADDWQPFHTKLDAVERMGEAHRVGPAMAAGTTAR